MKNILFATTALVATAGMAAAEVTIGGYARAGVLYVEGNEIEGFDEDGNSLGTFEKKEVRYETRLRMNIDAKATSDAGVAFQARFRIQSDDTAAGGITGGAVNAARFSAEAGGLRIDAGNAGGAIDNLPGYYGAYETGLTGFTGQYSGVDYSFAGYSSSGAGVANPTIYGRYANGGFAGAISYTQFSVDGDTTTSTPSELGVHLAYSFDAFTVAAGYSDTRNADQENMWVLTGQYGAGPLSASILVGSEKILGESDTFYGLAAAYDVSPALTIGANYGDGNGTGDVRAYGLGATYSLGGGVTIRGGIGQEKPDGGDSSTIADLGVRFNF